VKPETKPGVRGPSDAFDLKRRRGDQSSAVQRFGGPVAEASYARLLSRPDAAEAMQKLGIQDASGLQEFGRRMAREATGQAARTTDPKLSTVRDPSALKHLMEGAAASVKGEPGTEKIQSNLFARGLALGQNPFKAASVKTPEEAAALTWGAELKPLADKPTSQWNHGDAQRFTEALSREVAAAKGRPDEAKALLTLAGPQLQRAAELLGTAARKNDFDEGQVEGLSRAFGDLAAAAPDQKTAAKIAWNVAQQLPDSEELWQVDDGFGDDFKPLLAGALVTQGKEAAARGVLEEGGGFWQDLGGAVLDAGKGFLAGGPVGASIALYKSDDFREVAGAVGGAVKDAAGAAWNFVEEQAIGRLGDALRDVVGNVLHTDQQVDALKQPGDTFAADLGIEGNLFGAQAGVDVKMTMTRTENGRYAMELTGEGSLALAQKLNLPGVSEAAAELKATGSVSLKFDFPDAAAAKKATETIAGITAGVALAGAPPLAPLGAAMVASAGDEVKSILGAYSGAEVKLSVAGSLSAELGTQLGLPGASAGATAAGALAVEIPKSGPPVLVLSQSISVEGELAVAGKLPIPGVGDLSPGNVKGSASVDLTHRVPLDLDVKQLLKDPVGALSRAGKAALETATTTVEANFEFDAGLKLGGGNVMLGANEGIQVKVGAETKTKDLAAVFGKVFSGNLAGALSTLGDKVQLSAEVNAFQSMDVGLGSARDLVDGDEGSDAKGEGVGIPGVGNLEVTAAFSRRTHRPLGSYEGTPAELLAQFGALVRGVSYNAGPA
jgi:hypothetical protein